MLVPFRQMWCLSEPNINGFFLSSLILQIRLYNGLVIIRQKENDMSRIKLTPDELRTSAIRYTEGSDNIDAILSSLSNEQSVIRENWEGTAFDSFDAQFEALKPKIVEFSELLRDINAQLNKVADIIEQTDADIAAQING